MALSRTRYPERVLIVLNPDGTLKGAHQEELEITDDNGVLSYRQLMAAGVDQATLATILPTQATLTAQTQALTTDLATMTAARDALATERNALVAERDALLAQVEALQAEIAAAAAEASVVATVTNYQARTALIEAGLFAQADAAVKAAGPASLLFQAWEYAAEFRRDSPFIAQMAAVLNLTSAQVDALFAAASQVN